MNCGWAYSLVGGDVEEDEGKEGLGVGPLFERLTNKRASEEFRAVAQSRR